jgi:hypothetical protein
VYAVVPPEKLPEFTEHLMEHLVRMAHEVTPAEIEKAKTQLKVRREVDRLSGPGVGGWAEGVVACACGSARS